MQMWGIYVTSWQPAPHRVGRLPEPLEFDVLQDGLIELDVGQRHTLLQCISCYQVCSGPMLALVFMASVYSNRFNI